MPKARVGALLVFLVSGALAVCAAGEPVSTVAPWLVSNSASGGPLFAGSRDACPVTPKAALFTAAYNGDGGQCAQPCYVDSDCSQRNVCQVVCKRTNPPCD